MFIPLYFVPFLGSPRIFLKLEEPLDFFERKLCTGSHILFDSMLPLYLVIVCMAAFRMCI